MELETGKIASNRQPPVLNECSDAVQTAGEVPTLQIVNEAREIFVLNVAV